LRKIAEIREGAGTYGGENRERKKRIGVIDNSERKTTFEIGIGAGG